MPSVLCLGCPDLDLLVLLRDWPEIHAVAVAPVRLRDPVQYMRNFVLEVSPFARLYPSTLSTLANLCKISSWRSCHTTLSMGMTVCCSLFHSWPIIWPTIDIGLSGGTRGSNRGRARVGCRWIRCLASCNVLRSIPKLKEMQPLTRSLLH